MSYTPADASQQFPSAVLPEGVATATSTRSSVTCTSSATPHSAGSWVEIDPSLSAASSGIIVALTASVNAPGTNTSTLIEIGTGASGAESVWQTIAVGYSTATTTVNSPAFYAPGHLAAGTRIVVRARSVIATQQVTAIYTFMSVKEINLGAPVTYGVNTGASQGTILSAPGSLNVKGSWTEITPATSAASSVLSVSFQFGGVTSMSGTGVLIDVGLGGSGNSVDSIAVSDIYVLGNANEICITRGSPLLYGIRIPAGTRIAARYARANSSNAVDLIVVAA